MAKMEMKDKKTVRIAEKPLLPPPWGGCGVTGLGWFVSILAAGYWQLACVSQLQVCRGECQRSFFFFFFGERMPKELGAFIAFIFASCITRNIYIYIYIYIGRENVQATSTWTHDMSENQLIQGFCVIMIISYSYACTCHTCVYGIRI